MQRQPMSDEQVVRQKWGKLVMVFEGGDGCHIEIAGVEHPHFSGNIPSNAWKRAAEWTRARASHEGGY